MRLFYCLYLINICSAFISYNIHTRCKIPIIKLDSFKCNMLPSKLIEEVSKNANTADITIPISFGDLLSRIDQHKIQAVTFIKGNDGLFAIDKVTNRDLSTTDIHPVIGITQFSDFLLKKLYDNNIDFDVFVPPVNQLSQLSFPLYYLVDMYYIYLLLII